MCERVASNAAQGSKAPQEKDQKLKNLKASSKTIIYSGHSTVTECLLCAKHSLLYIGRSGRANHLEFLWKNQKTEMFMLTNFFLRGQAINQCHFKLLRNTVQDAPVSVFTKAFNSRKSNGVLRK